MKKKTNRNTKSSKIEIDQILLNKREIFLNTNVNEESILKMIKEIRTLDAINHKPIFMWLNSPGGSVADGFALINTMKSVHSRIITIVNSEVCSMGSQIAIAGDERWIYPNGVIMFHDMSSGVRDYSLKIKDRACFLEKYYNLLEDHMRNHTKLTNREIIKARTGELWLFAEDCLDKGIVDKILCK